MGASRTHNFTDAALKRMVGRIVRKFHPEQVILFGSRGRRQALPDSDVDLLVVMPVEGSKREKAVEIRMALGARGVPVDVVVSRPEDYAWRKDVIGTIEWPASREGKVVYARD